MSTSKVSEVVGQGSIPKLSVAAMRSYARYKTLADEEKAIMVTVKKIKEERAKIAELLEAKFTAANSDVMLMPFGRVLQKKVISVEAATIQRKAYEYTKWEELA